MVFGISSTISDNITKLGIVIAAKLHFSSTDAEDTDIYNAKPII